jgi:hypothetical protein
MTRALIVGGVLAIVLVLLLLAIGLRDSDQGPDPAVITAPAIPLSTTAAVSGNNQGFLYGRVTTNDGATSEGRLRWGGNEEAFWGDYFNGFKNVNPWVAHVAPEKLKEIHPIEVFGFEIARWERQTDVDRPFMARFGDIARIEAQVRDIRVTLKSGTVFHLDRFSADDLADGLRVWDGSRGAVDLDEWQIHIIEFLPTPRPSAVPLRLHGTVHTRHGTFNGFIQWNRKACVGTDEFRGHTVDGDLSLRFDTIRSIARNPDDSTLVTLIDGREIVLPDSREGDHWKRGIYVDDRRYGRVLISRDAFQRVDFSPDGSGPAYDDFPSGLPLTGSITTLSGRRLSGRLVYDLDESETTETLDAPSQGIDYTLPFGLIASIVLPGREEHATRHARVILHSGEELQLERAGDLGDGNAGMLIFIDGREQPEYLPWADVRQVDFDRPPSTR